MYLCVFYIYIGRSRYLDDGVIKVFETSEKPDHPAGDSFPESSCVDNMLEQISKVL